MTTVDALRDYEARSFAFVTGFTVACIELAKSHGHDELAYRLLNEAGITREKAKAATEADDHEAIDDIFELAADD